MAPIEFARSERGTLGIEWELALVDQDSGDLRQVAQTVLDAVEGRLALAGTGSQEPVLLYAVGSSRPGR